LYAKEFIFNDISCNEFGLMICSFDNNSNGTMGADIEFVTTSNPVLGKWRKLESKEVKPLEFQVQVCKEDNTYIDSYERQAITRWLSRRDGYKKLQFVQDDYERVWFNAYVASIEFVEIGNQVAGLTINWKCDASHGYGELYQNEVKDSESPLIFFDQSDDVGYIYPNVEIEVTKNGTVDIYNFTDGRTFRIYNCQIGEKIIQNGDILQLSTSLSSHTNLYNDFNFNFFRIINDYETRKNVIATSGCNINFSYYPIKKVGI
jgi:hypothetical protein